MDTGIYSYTFKHGAKETFFKKLLLIQIHGIICNSCFPCLLVQFFFFPLIFNLGPKLTEEFVLTLLIAISQNAHRSPSAVAIFFQSEN